MVRPVIPNTGIGGTVRYKRSESAQNGTGKNVIPVVGHVEHECTDDASSEREWEAEEDNVEVGWMCVSKDLELAVDVERGEDETSKSGRRVTGWERLERVCNHLLVRIGTNTGIEVDILKSLAQSDKIRSWYLGLTDGEEVRSQSSIDKLDNDLDHATCHNRIDDTPDSVVDVPERTDTELHRQNENDRDGDGDDGVGNDGNVL